MKQRATPILVLLLAVSLAAGCAASLKDRAVKSAQVAHLSVGSAQDTEIALFNAGAVPGYSEAQHKYFHASLVKYWDAEAKVITLLRAWRAGDPAPANLPEALAALSEAAGVLKSVSPQALASVLSYIQSASAAMQNILALTGKGA